MSEHDLEKLLGGFAADTLTHEERQTLFAAALQDQQLFNALADEQALKDRLADPAVRRRLLTALERQSTSGTGAAPLWLDWFRRPAGLAFAGGLTAAALAVVLGIRIYQDSLRQAAQPVITEETRPATPTPTAPGFQPTSPNVTVPHAKTNQNSETIGAPAKTDLLVDTLGKRERVEPTSPSDPVGKQAEAPVAALGKPSQELISSENQQPATNSAPPTGSAPASLQAPANGPVAEAVATAVSVRALFYGGAPDSRSMAQEHARTSKPLAEPAPQSNRLDGKLDQLAQKGNAAETIAQLKPLGLRYSFVVRGTDGQDREVDATTAARTAASVRLTIETNQTAYLQIWKSVGSATPQLLLPEKDTGQISLKMSAGQRQQISLPTDSGPLTLTARLSRLPFGPITRQEAAMFDRVSPNQLQESFTATTPTSSQEQATYVVTQDLTTTAQISVEIPLSR